MLKRTTLAAALALGFAALSTGALAKEGGDQYPNGAETFMSGAIPPAGTYFINYAGYYSGTLKDNSGNTVRLPNTKGNLQDVKVSAWFDALRLVHVTGIKLLGADWTVDAILPIVHQNFDLPPLGGSKTTTGIGDLTLNPIILGWHFPNLHVTAGLDINLPTGNWDRTDPRKSLGANYYSFEPILAVSYLADNGFEASTKLMYNIKTKNTDSNYQSGDESHADYLLGYRNNGWAYGLGGYFLKQTTDDTLNGRSVGLNGNKGQVLAFGPHVQYMGKNGDQFIFQWQHETAVKNRFEGDKVWFKYIHRF